MTTFRASAFALAASPWPSRPHRAARRLRQRPAQERGALAAERERRVQGIAAAAGFAARSGQPSARRWHGGIRGAAGEPARLPGRRQQMGVVVRAVSDGVPGVPARVRRDWTQGRVPRARRQGPEPSGATSFLRNFPVTYPSYVDPHESDRAQDPAATYYPQTFYMTETARSSSSMPGRTRVSARSRRTSGTTRWDDRDRSLRGAPRARRAGDDRCAGAATRRVLRRAGCSRVRRARRPRSRGNPPRCAVENGVLLGTCRIADGRDDRAAEPARGSRVRRAGAGSPLRCSTWPMRRRGPRAGGGSYCTPRSTRASSTRTRATAPAAARSCEAGHRPHRDGEAAVDQRPASAGAREQ